MCKKPMRPTMTREEFEELPMVLTCADAAAICGGTIRNMQMLAERGSIPAVKLGGRWLINKDALAARLGL